MRVCVCVCVCVWVIYSEYSGYRLDWERSFYNYEWYWKIRVVTYLVPSCTADTTLVFHMNLCFCLLQFSKVCIQSLFYESEDWDWEKIKRLAFIAKSHPSLDLGLCSFVPRMWTPWVSPLSCCFQACDSIPAPEQLPLLLAHPEWTLIHWGLS